MRSLYLLIADFRSTCLEHQQVDPNICCETVDRITSFCFIQCNLPLPNNCVCVDSTTGDRLAGLFTFPEPNPNDPNPFDCDIVLPLGYCYCMDLKLFRIALK